MFFCVKKKTYYLNGTYYYIIINYTYLLTTFDEQHTHVYM